MKKEDLKIVFFGTPEFAVGSLNALLKEGFNVAAVVTMPDKPAGRGKKIKMSDVKRYALQHDLTVLQPEKLKSPEFLNKLQEIGADLFIVIAFRMLPEAVWAMPRLGTFNLHASLLPNYRGAAPINHAIINGETVTGITTFFLKHEIDTGDMILQRTVEIGEDDNVGIIHDKLMDIGAGAVIDTVNSIIEGNLILRPQPEGEFTPAPKIFKDTCRINWHQPAKKIHDFIRGLSPYPGAWSIMTEMSGKPSDVKIFSSSLKDIPSGLELAPGQAIVLKKNLYVGSEDHPLRIRSLQPAGKKEMAAEAFILGYHPKRFE